LEDDEARRLEDQASFLRNQRLNLYGNLGLAGPQNSAVNHHYAHSASNSLAGHDAAATATAGINLALSMGVNIGSYGYQNGRGNLLQQLNYSNVHGASNNNDDSREQDEIRARSGNDRPGEEDLGDSQNDEVNELLQDGDEDECE